MRAIVLFARMSAVVCLVFASLAIAGCDNDEKILEVETSNGEVEVERDRDTGQIEVETDDH